MASDDIKPDIDRIAPTSQRSVFFVFAMVIVGVVLAFLMTHLKLGGPSPSTVCKSNLHNLGLALRIYAGDHGGQLPDFWEPLILGKYVSGGMLVCPSSKDPEPSGATAEEQAMQLTALGRPENYATAASRPKLHLSYVYCGAGMTWPMSPQVILAYEPISNHGDAIQVLYADTQVAIELKQTALEIISELQAGHNPPRPEKIR